MTLQPSQAAYLLPNGVNPDTPKHKLAALLETIIAIDMARPFFYADWLRLYLDAYPNKSISDALEILKGYGKWLPYATAQNYLVVSRRFPPSSRTWPLNVVTMSHYSEVSKFSDEQASALLQLVCDEGLSVAELRKRKALLEPQGGEDDAIQWSGASVKTVKHVHSAHIDYKTLGDSQWLEFERYMHEEGILDKIKSGAYQVRIEIYEVLERDDDGL